MRIPAFGASGLSSPSRLACDCEHGDKIGSQGGVIRTVLADKFPHFLVIKPAAFANFTVNLQGGRSEQNDNATIMEGGDILAHLLP